MDGRSESDLDFLRSLKASEPARTWAQPGDLGRMSIQSFVSRQTVGIPRSTGALRLFGQGVAGSSVRLDLVGIICQEFQRLVVSVGASLEGVKTARGRISEAIARRARLNLSASPMPGSLILDLTPELDPESERVRPGQPALLVDDPEPLADRSVKSILEVLRKASRPDPDASELGELLNELGPRVASSVSLLAKVFAEDEMDVELAWAQANQATDVAALSAGAARWLRGFVTARHLDESPVTFTGVLRTVSDRRPLELETDEGEMVYLRRSEDSPVVVGDLFVGEEVIVRASEKLELKVGGEEVRTHTLLSVSRVLGKA